MNKKILTVLKALAKLLIAGLLIYWVAGKEWKKIAELISSVSPVWIILCFFTLFIQAIGTSIRWRSLIAPELHVTLYDAFRLTMIGLFSNIFIPGGAVGGDVVKAAFLSARTEAGKRVDAAVSVLVDRIVGLIGLFLLNLFLAALYLKRILALDAASRYIVWLLCLMCITGIAVSFVIFFQDFIFRWKPAKMLLDWADRWMKGIPGNIIRSVSSYRSRWKTVFRNILFSMLILHPLLMLSIYFALFGVLQNPPDAGLTMTAMAFGNSASALPITPGGIGTRDYVVKILLSGWGFHESSAAAAMMIYTSMMLLLNLCSGIGFFLPGDKISGKMDQKKNPSN